MTNGSQEAQSLEATNLLLDARRTAQPITNLPESLQPNSVKDAYAIQDGIAVAYGAIGGWKVGSATADGTPMFAPMPARGIAPSGVELKGIRYKGLEAEVAFLLGQDLPQRDAPYSREDVVEAIASCHPAIEVLESAFADPMVVPRMAMIADLQMHGAFVYGAACADWKQIDFSKEAVRLAVEGMVRVERVGSNTAGDLMRLLPWLANEGAARTGGLRAGQWITTGSWTGNTLASGKDAVDVQFATVGQVSLHFA